MDIYEAQKRVRWDDKEQNILAKEIAEKQREERTCIFGSQQTLVGPEFHFCEQRARTIVENLYWDQILKDLPCPVKQVDLYLVVNRKQTEVLKESGTG